MHRFLLLFLFLGLISNLQGQNLNGKWVGYFTPNTDLEGKTYAYEITITEAANHQLNAVAITLFSNNRTAKALANGLYTPQSQLVSIIETKFEQVQLDQNMQACLMSNFLNYQKIREHEILQGSYMSSNVTNGKDCGGGTVYLEKVQSIVKMTVPKNAANKTTTINPKLVAKNNLPATNKQNIKQQIITNAQFSAASKKINTTAKTSTTKTVNANPTQLNNKGNTPQENNTTTKITQVNSSPIVTNNTNTPIVLYNTIKEIKQPEMILPEDAAIENKEEEVVVKKSNDFQVIPWVLVGRENKLVKKLVTHNKTISIDLYDNGTIDNDTINVYDNKQLIINKKRLSYKAIHIDLNFTNSIKEHEVIIVAHNMGTVPPNTALLVYKDGTTRQELFITSTNKMNAKLVIEYEPPN